MEASLRAVSAWPQDHVVVLHLESTGMDEKSDEPVSITLARPDGEILLDTLVKPRAHTAWPQAEDMHGIRPEDVEHAPTLLDLNAKLNGFVPHGTLIVGYGLDYDLGILKTAGINWKPRDTFDVMLGYARAYGKEVGDDEFEVPSLEDMCEHYGVTGCGYGPRGDCKRIAACYNALIRDETYVEAKRIPPKQLAITALIAVSCLVLLIGGCWAVFTTPEAFMENDKDGLLLRAAIVFITLFVFPILYGVGSQRWH